MKAPIYGAVLFISLTLAAQNAGTQSTNTQTAENSSAVRVPDAATAVLIAEPALVKVYGRKQIEYEKPLKAVLDGQIWHVYGTLCCRDSKGKRTCEFGKCVGGVAQAEIRRSDGKVLRILHTM